MNFYLLVWLCFSAGARLFVRCVEKVLALVIAWSCDFLKYFMAGIYLSSTVTESFSDDWHQQKESKERAAASSKQRNKINYISFSLGGTRGKIFIVDKDFERMNSNFIYHQRHEIEKVRQAKSGKGKSQFEMYFRLFTVLWFGVVSQSMWVLCIIHSATRCFRDFRISISTKDSRTWKFSLH